MAEIIAFIIVILQGILLLAQIYVIIDIERSQKNSKSGLDIAYGYPEEIEWLKKEIKKKERIGL